MDIRGRSTCRAKWYVVRAIAMAIAIYFNGLFRGLFGTCTYLWSVEGSVWYVHVVCAWYVRLITLNVLNVPRPLIIAPFKTGLKNAVKL